jgi:hypothetical protein
LYQRLEHLHGNEHALMQIQKLADEKEEEFKAFDVENKLVKGELLVCRNIKASCAYQEVDAKHDTRDEQEPLPKEWSRLVVS